MDSKYTTKALGHLLLAFGNVMFGGQNEEAKVETPRRRRIKRRNADTGGSGAGDTGKGNCCIARRKKGADEK